MIRNKRTILTGAQTENKALTRSSAVVKRLCDCCDCCVGQFWSKYNWKRIFCSETYRSVFKHCDVKLLGVPTNKLGN